MTEVGALRYQGYRRPLAAAPIAPRHGPFGAFTYAVVLVLLLGLASTLTMVVVPRFFGYPTLTVQGGSMGDAAPKGSLVIARWTQPQNVHVGDIILVRMPSASATANPKIHRVVSLQSEDGKVIVETKGDANANPDPGLYVLPERVAVHSMTVRDVGFAVDFVRTPLGWGIFVALPALILCLLTLRDIWSEDAKPVLRKAAALR